jgi:hypothetical protein
MDINQDSYLKMGTFNTTTGYINHYVPAYSSSSPVCVLGYYKPYANASWVIAPFQKFALEFQAGSGSYPNVYCYGNWNFS